MKHAKYADLSEIVASRLNEIPELGDDELAVKSDDGVVTLTGRVKNQAEKALAERTAIQTHGVNAVVSELHVAPRLERTDEEIAKDILRAWASHAGIPAGDLRAIVSEGRVTLEGTVSCELGKLFAEAAVKRLRGITGIRNEIEIIASPVSAGAAPEALNRNAKSSEMEDYWAEMGAAEPG
jgi:osmotically-inducible protein OsmY